MDRNAAWKELKKAAKRLIEAERWFDVSASDADWEEAQEAFSAADRRMVDAWHSFPECSDQSEGVPPASDILRSIVRQDRALEQQQFLR